MIIKKRISAPHALNEAPDYGASFSRASKFTVGGMNLLLISGTAAIGPDGRTEFPGDFALQLRKAYSNISALLTSAGATWHDVIRLTCYLKDIDRDYDTFNRIRTEYFQHLGLAFPPASTGIQVRLCRPDLLVEMEAMALWEELV